MRFTFSGLGRAMPALALLAFLAFFPREAAAQPTIRVAKSYEDTVRILILYNEGARGSSSCHLSTVPVGSLTRDFVVQSVTGIPNVKVLPTVGTTWAIVEAQWPGRLPHVIVHVNAGWQSHSGPDVVAVLNTAAAQRIGVVSIGDDAAHFADQVFGFTNVSNVPPPMGDATQYTGAGHALWLSLDGKSDTLPAPGVIRNTVDSLGFSRLEFKSVSADGSGEFRCQADADKYSVLPAFLDKLTFLGYQRAFNGKDTIGGPRELQTVVAFQDGVRRGVALSFQPQFLKNKQGSHQVVYDAILYASFAHQFNLKASLAFTDETGAPLAYNALWSPEKGKLYLTFKDDHRPTLGKTVTLVIRNRNGLAPSDSETVTLTAPLAATDSGRGVWNFVVDLDEAYSPTPLNGIAETYFIGQVRATVPTHSFDGKPDSGFVTAELRVARADQPEAVKLADADRPGVSIDRATGGILVTVTDQDFSDLTDTIWARLACERSGDGIAKVALVEVSPGVYRSVSIMKTEGPANVLDLALQCLDTDKLKVTYVDEIYGKQVEDFASWNPQGVTALRFTSAQDTSVHITSMLDAGTNAFSLKVQFPTPTVGVVDQLTVSLVLPAMDAENVIVIETGPNTGVFVPAAPIPWRYQLTPGENANGVVEALLDATGNTVEVVLQASATSGPTTETASLRLVTAFTKASSAYIKDRNDNGAGDAVFVVFSRPLAQLPPAAANTLFWNDGGPAFGNAFPPQISLLPGSGDRVLVYDLSGHEFPFGLTRAAPGGNPHVDLPADHVFGSLKPGIADSMGPVLRSGLIYPQNPLLLQKGQTSLGIDTLIITVSEPLRTATDWTALLRFSTALPNGQCPDYAVSVPLELNGTPRIAADGVTHTLFVDKNSRTPVKGNCIFLTVNGTYTDLSGNLPVKRGVKLGGREPPRQLELVRAYPPVAGIGAEDPRFSLINNDPRTGNNGYTTETGGKPYVAWIPPVGYVDGAPYVSPMPTTPAEAVDPLRIDAGTVREMPKGISTVQVISTGRYIVTVALFDNMGNFVKTFRQSFGYWGEIFNNARITNKGLMSFLVWDMKDSRGQRAGQGVYVWKLLFIFDDGKQEVQYVRTGVLRDLTLP